MQSAECRAFNRTIEEFIKNCKTLKYVQMNNKVQKKQSCQTDVSGSFSLECNRNFPPQTHSFKDCKYYRNEKYFGDVIYSDEKIIQVECKNGNKYMEGQIITMQLVGS